MAIPQNFIQELLSRADVVEIVGRYVQLKKGGANYMGLCPFHGEKSPSFSVSPSKQFYHCFGCGKNGNAIGFLMDYAGMGFVEAVKDLAGQYGMQVPEDERSPADRERAAQDRQKQATLSDVLEKAGAAWRKQLRGSAKAVDYLKGRGVTGEIAKVFGLGYAPEGWRGLASVFPDYDDPLLAESGLVIVNDDDGKRYDRFRDRVMFPIRNVKGECIGFGGRVLGDEKPKYLNSPETPIFSKGRELYGLFEARNALREHGYVLVTEGYMDVVALAQLGFPNAVATLGTACTTDHVQKLFRFTDSVVFSFDGDAAGRRAARKALDGALPYATDVRTVKFLFLPAEHDPDTFIREFGQDAFARYVHDATPLSRFLVEVAREGCDLATAEGRAHMAANAKPMWMQLPEGALKRQLLTEIAELAQLGPHELGELWGLAPAAPPRQKWRPPAPPAASRPRVAGRQLPVSRPTRALQIVLTEPLAWERLSHDDHHLLCELPAPHGPMFAWLDAQHHDHGAQPWSALREALRGHEHEDFVAGEVAKLPPEIESDPAELAQILAQERKLRQAEEMKRLSATAATDPQAYERLKVLVEAQKAKRPS
ncbi:DNA primase [Ramlibacter sp.]|uniref:DNA primase n=1 Tax=Ramlibacter sp. TaxID=1917967 RepID=UPI003D120939